MILNEEKNILNGYAILKIFTNNETSEKTGHIVDLLTTNCYAAENLLKYSENYFFINDVNKITSYCNSNNLNYKTFENLGYKLSKKQPVLRIKKLSDKKIKLDLDSINNLLDITMLNHDVY
ncbi:hypothetical protein HN415_00625 [Candidatus Woesearchaeota archaeon]|nr:hypothetical protein [Candidatus Woesearchaeota archaeon]